MAVESLNRRRTLEPGDLDVATLQYIARRLDATGPKWILYELDNFIDFQRKTSAARERAARRAKKAVRFADLSEGDKDVGSRSPCESSIKEVP